MRLPKFIERVARKAKSADKLRDPSHEVSAHRTRKVIRDNEGTTSPSSFIISKYVGIVVGEQTRAGHEQQIVKYGMRKSIAMVHSNTLEPLAETPSSQTSDWIEIVLHDDVGDPVPGIKLELDAPDGKVHSGVTDSTGKVYIQKIASGLCRLRLPQDLALSTGVLASK
jgi:hypothetical protein